MSSVLKAPTTLVADPYSMPLEELDPAKVEIFQNDALWGYFKRLRDEDPVHFHEDSDFGPYWSITKFDDIMFVDTNEDLFSSEGGITIGPMKADAERAKEFQTPMFIAMDPPKHDVQRATVVPVVAPKNLAAMESIIRERAAKILDSLPIGETFDWVDTVSIELTTQMLATLFDFPFEERRKLTRWSDIATSGPDVISTEERRAELLECLEYFTRLWEERKEGAVGLDLISMLSHGENTKNMQPMEFLGNLILLIVGGNDTTRNSISGGVVALNENPEQYQKLRDNHALITSMVPEIIRWQTPLSHMRRVAKEDVEVGGKTIKKGDKVVMWYVSGNRDETAIDNPDSFIIDRARPRHHLSFGFGIHRCMGNRLAEMQLRVLWEEILQRFNMIEIVGDIDRTPSIFVKGYTHIPVKLHAK
ncbi:MAG: cytochrome P450 [Gammaproteobacteria bacterium]|nr:cytochrome P450 [Gammaproteobacteria bacterium]